MQSKMSHADAIGGEVKAVDRAMICRYYSITDASVWYLCTVVGFRYGTPGTLVVDTSVDSGQTDVSR